MAIMYVCEPCGEHYPEGCGHYDRNELRVLPDGTWVCEDCYDNGEDEHGRWSKLPVPPKYAPKDDPSHAD